MTRTHALAAAICLFALLAPLAAADTPATLPPPDDGRGKVILSWDEFVKITGYDPAKKGSQVLTVPWTEIEQMLNIELKTATGITRATVDLPWDDFKALLEWSVKMRTGGPHAPPPADYVVASCQYRGVLGAEMAEFTMTLKIDVLKDTGWKTIPILPASVAVVEATLPDGVFLNVAESKYMLLTSKTGPIGDIVLKFSEPVRKQAGITTVYFDRIITGSAVLDLEAEGTDVDVKVANAASSLTTQANGKTRVAASLPAGHAVSISWERAVAKPPPTPSKLYAETKTLIAVAEGQLLGTETVDFNVLHSAVRELKLIVPAGVSVLEVTGPKLADWRVTDQRELVLTPRGEVLGPYSVRISYEAPADQETAIVPILRAAAVEREKGFVGVIALANVEITPGDVTGATLIDVRQLPADIAAMTKQPILLGFRYVAESFTIPLAIRKHGEVTVLVTVADSALVTTMQLDDGRRMTKAVYTVRNNRNQFLRVKMPAGADVWSASVSSNAVTPAADSEGNLLIPLVRSASEAAELSSFPVELVYIEAPKEAPASSGKLHVELPRLDAPTVHVLVSYYAPAEGRYGPPKRPASAFSGTLRLVEEFTQMAVERAQPVPVDAAKQAEALQQTMDVRVEADARATGATPIKVRLPVNGRLFKLEKVLATPGDNLFFDVEYSNWPKPN